MRRKASAKWIGPLKNHQGWLSTESGALKEMPYSFTARFEDGKGTTPEELIAAAHAGCFSMALAANLASAGGDVGTIQTSATVSFEKVDENWTIVSSHLSVDAQVSGIAETKFYQLAEDAKANCPVSRALKAELSLDARLSGGMSRASAATTSPLP